MNNENFDFTEYLEKSFESINFKEDDVDMNIESLTIDLYKRDKKKYFSNVTFSRSVLSFIDKIINNFETKVKKAEDESKDFKQKKEDSEAKLRYYF